MCSWTAGSNSVLPDVVEQDSQPVLLNRHDCAVPPLGMPHAAALRELSLRAGCSSVAPAWQVSQLPHGWASCSPR